MMTKLVNNHPGYVVVEGPIGVGKTSLARRLADSFGSELLLEGAEENPFLERFYRDPKNAALPTQLFFLFQRARQLQDMRQSDMFRPVRVADFLIEKDRMFARMTLDQHELELYDQIYEKMTLDAPVPDLVIYLQAPVDVLQSRITKRGIDYEQHMQGDYLRRVAESYMEFFYHYTGSPLLIVNATEIDLASNEKDYNNLLEQVCNIKRGRHYFNPMPIAL
ncbi:MAG: deoxynucleoside kinase [Gammaproteobacteria bacterium]|nr:deoxynucleoside kinase [Gammaproteobacteria bacterium]MDH5614538.1 deoxynucleoside kinase [Gammaproteobacteria bacterium]